MIFMHQNLRKLIKLGELVNQYLLLVKRYSLSSFLFFFSKTILQNQISLVTMKSAHNFIVLKPRIRADKIFTKKCECLIHKNQSSRNFVLATQKSVFAKIIFLKQLKSLFLFKLDLVSLLSAQDFDIGNLSKSYPLNFQTNID